MQIDGEYDRRVYRWDRKSAPLLGTVCGSGLKTEERERRELKDSTPLPGTYFRKHCHCYMADFYCFFCSQAHCFRTQWEV